MTDSVHECVFSGSSGQKGWGWGVGGIWLVVLAGVLGCVGRDTGSPGPLRLDRRHWVEVTQLLLLLLLLMLRQGCPSRRVKVTQRRTHFCHIASRVHLISTETTTDKLRKTPWTTRVQNLCPKSGIVMCFHTIFSILCHKLNLDDSICMLLSTTVVIDHVTIYMAFLPAKVLEYQRCQTCWNVDITQYSYCPGNE